MTSPYKSTEYVLDEQIDLQEYDRFARQHPLCNLLQAPPWAGVKANWEVKRVGLRDVEGLLQAVAQILIKPIFAGLSFWYIPHGPLLDYSDSDLLSAFLSALAELSKRRSCIFLRIHPPCPIRIGSIDEFKAGEAKTVTKAEYLISHFTKTGFTFDQPSLAMADTIQPRFQAVILKNTWEEPPRGKIRYNLKQNDRYQVDCVSGPEYLDKFDKLVRLTEKRQEIVLRNKSYFKRILDSFGQDSLLALAEFDLDKAQNNTAEKLAALEEEASMLAGKSPKKLKQVEEQIVSREKDRQFYNELKSELSDAGHKGSYHPSGILAIRYGKTADMPYAGSDERFSRLPAVWKLYVEGIRWSFSAGCERYNLGGLEGSFDDGLTIFKSHFNPQIEETIGEFDYPAKPFLYKLLKPVLNILKR